MRISRFKTLAVWLGGVTLMTLTGSSGAAADKLQYPAAVRGETVDELHGVKVADPYRWLEDDVRTSADSAKWVEDENKITFGYLDQIAERPAIRAKLEAMWNYERFSTPTKRGDYYFYSRNDGLQNQAVVYVAPALDAPPEVLIDPNTWTKDGTASLAGMSLSDDGKRIAYAVAEAGSDWKTWRVMDVATRKVLDDELKWCKSGGVSWTPDGKGFFYPRYPEPAPGETFQSLNLNQKLYYHRIGMAQRDDALVYERPDEPTWGFSGGVSEDGRWLVITVWKGTDNKYQVYYRDLTEPYAAPTALINNFENEFSFLGNDGTLFYFITDKNAPRRRIVAIDVTNPQPEKWKEIIGEAPDALSSAGLVNNMFVTEYLHDAKPLVKIYSLGGKFVRSVDFPSIGSAGGFGGMRYDYETFYVFSSFGTPPSIYRYDMSTGESTLWKRSGAKANPDDYEVAQVFVTSKDGVKFPMFVVKKKGVELNGDNPTLLYGYGGFNIPLTASFSPARVAWLDMGGVYAMANLRGGGEYGEEWHKAGTRLQKQNVFNDFIAAAEWLIANKYTKPEKLAISGRSNGGLLVGAVMTQRPDLFGACLPGVGVMDMLRFHKFTAGRFWVDDYGSPDDPEEFKALHAYSPYHNLKPGTKYPPTMVTTADTDDRVVPGHSFKFAAALQHAQAGAAPVLIRIETKAGHGAGKPTSKIIDETADEYAFLLKELKMKLPASWTTAK